MNRFLYAEGNPWTFVDPSGHAACASASSDLCDETTAIQHKNTQAGKNAAKRVSGRDWDYYWRQRALKSTGPSRGYDSDPQATPEWASGDDWGEGTSIGQASASQTAAQAAATTCTRTRWGQSCQSAQQQADSAATLAGIGDTLSAFGNGLLQMGTCVGSGGTSCDARMLIGLGQMASNPGGTVATIAADRWSAIQSGDKRTGAAAVSATILDVLGLALAPFGGEAADVAEIGAVGEELSDVPVVIGENMEGRVIPHAKEFGYDYYRPDPDAPPAEWLRNNVAWIRQQMAAGRQIIDIGPDPGRSAYPGETSPFYAAEHGAVFGSGYSNYIQHVLDETVQFLQATAH